MMDDEVVDRKFWCLDSAFDAVEPVCRFVKSRLESLGFAAAVFDVELLLRESFANAAGHGNGLSSEKKVECTMTLYNDTIELDVADEGDGFDWRSSMGKLPEEDQLEENGRGVVMYRMLADTVRFNDKGNRVVLRKKLVPAKDKECEVCLLVDKNADVNLKVVACNERDLTAGASEDFRKNVAHLVENSLETVTFTLDLKNVRTIDSRGLAALISLYKLLQTRKQVLKLIRVSDSLCTLFCRVNLNRHFIIEGISEQAGAGTEQAVKPESR